MRKNKAALRLAIAIHDQLTYRDQTNVACELPEVSWQQCQTLAHRVQLAQQRGWTLAAARCERDLRAMIDILHGQLGGIAQELNANNRCDRSAASIEDTYHDVLALHDEFDEVTWDRRQQTLSVTTEPVELEGIYLGPFQIQLDWGNLIDGHPGNYRVVAVDAHPAASNDSVTHPHVQDENACEGDGRVPIRNALEQGRLLDFFLIVTNLLRTYNADSPYVPLSDWHGLCCSDCGSSTCEDDSWSCAKCGATICDGCNYSCSDCGDIHCSECIDRCEGCDDHFCRCCLKRCGECRDLRCNGCLDKQERCGDCHEEQTKETVGQQVTDNGGHCDANAGTSLQSDRVGQADILA